MSSLTRPLVTEGAPALAAATGFAIIAVFQVALAAGAPLGRAAWGGTHPAQLPVGLRVGSAIAVGVWALAALIVLARAGVISAPLPPAFLRWGTWSLVGLTLIGALMNLASPSPWERYMWAPAALLLAGLCFQVARTNPAPRV
jgi:hypothetical protein